MDIQHFEQRLRDVEHDLEYAETSGIRFFERTASGEEKEITEDYKTDLRRARDEYRRVLEWLKAK